jgi:hypothetical protein
MLRLICVIQVFVMPPLMRLNPSWFPMEFASLSQEFRQAFRAAPSNLVVCSDFSVELSRDGVHLTAPCCSRLLDEFLVRVPGLPVVRPDVDEFAALKAESAQNRQLLLDLAEKVRNNESTTHSVSSRAAELIDTMTNRSNENQIEIKGETLFRFRLSL